MAASRPRPLSPHLSIWKWRVHMLVSILHRATGTAMATAGFLSLVWFLVAAASSPDSFESFRACATSWLGILVGVGLSWVFFQHLCSGLRHFVLDTGAGYELVTNKRWASATILISTLLTALLWALIAS